MLGVMRFRALLVAAFLAPASAFAQDDAAFGHALALIHSLIRAPSVDGLIAGHDPEANRAAAGLLQEMTEGMPAAHREKMHAIGRDMLARMRERDAASGALQARKDLAAMGLRYYDEQQFLDAARRGDTLAVELFIAGGGIDLRSLAERLARNPPEGR